MKEGFVPLLSQHLDGTGNSVNTGRGLGECAPAFHINMGVSAKYHIQLGQCSGIYYQNVNGIRTMQLELYENVSSTARNTSVINLTEIWLNAPYYYHILSTGCYIVFRSDRASVNKRGGGGVLTPLSSRVHSCKRRYGLEYCDERVCVGSPNTDRLNLLLGNNYFPLALNMKSLLIIFHF
jgi:hypothetical protein